MTASDAQVYLLLECGLIPTDTGAIQTEDGITHHAFVQRNRAIEYANRKVLEGRFIAWRLVELPLEGAEPPVEQVQVVCEVRWHHPTFARHPADGVPCRVFQHPALAEAACLDLDRARQAEQSPFDQPPLSALMLNSAVWIRWSEDEPLLRVLLDYVQDLGLPPPHFSGSLVTSWKLWWQRMRPNMEPWQWQSIWTFLDRLPHYRVCPVECDPH